MCGSQEKHEYTFVYNTCNLMPTATNYQPCKAQHQASSGNDTDNSEIQQKLIKFAVIFV